MKILSNYYTSNNRFAFKSAKIEGVDFPGKENLAKILTEDEQFKNLNEVFHVEYDNNSSKGDIKHYHVNQTTKGTTGLQGCIGSTIKYYEKTDPAQIIINYIELWYNHGKSLNRIRKEVGVPTIYETTQIRSNPD